MLPSAARRTMLTRLARSSSSGSRFRPFDDRLRVASGAEAVLAVFRAPQGSATAGRFFVSRGCGMLESLAQRAAARLLQSSAAREAGGGEADLEAAAEAAADAARDLVVTRPTPASAAAAPAAAAAAKAMEELDDISWGRRLLVGVESVGSGFVFGGLWVSPLSYRGVPGQTTKIKKTAKNQNQTTIIITVLAMVTC